MSHPSGEAGLIAWLTEHISAPPWVKLGVGDDMAGVCVDGAGDVWLTSDMLLDGVHFDTASHGLADIGRKAIACSLSDCAAMAVQPRAATVSVALPRDWSVPRATELYEGMQRIADGFECAIVGGDITSWAGRLAIDVTIMAIPYSGITPVTRSGARPGDALYVTGRLGGSGAGRHLTFTPRVREARLLAQDLQQALHAMMDISDGLALDLHRMCAASGVGACIDEASLEAAVHDDAVQAAASREAALQRALSDGEDFELLLAADGDVARSTERAAGDVQLHHIGAVTSEHVVLRRRDGHSEPLHASGYEHLRS